MNWIKQEEVKAKSKQAMNSGAPILVSILILIPKWKDVLMQDGFEISPMPSELTICSEELKRMQSNFVLSLPEKKIV